MTDDAPKPANEPVKPTPQTATTGAKGPPPPARPGNAPIGSPVPSGSVPSRPTGTPTAATAKPATPPFSGSASASIPPSGNPPPDGSSRTPYLIAIAILVIALIAGGIYVLQTNGASADQLAQLQSKLDSLNQRTASLEARPVPQPPPPPPPPPNLRPLEQRLTALENKPAPVAQLDQAGHDEIAALAGRVDGIAARQTLLGTQEQTDFGRAQQELKDAVGKVNDQEAADIGKLADQEKADVAKLNDQLASVGTRLDAAAKAAGQIGAIDARQGRLAQLQAASGALAAGRPLGAIPNAPPALAQFATKPAPTEADLRLSFDQAAAAARKAGQPYADTQPFLSRLWDRAQSGLVVREGSRVIVGDAVSGVLDSAKQQLDAGDVAAAVAALDGLAGPAAQAMAPWRAQAQSLLDARAALISAARG